MTGSNTKNVLKIKEAFPSLKVRNINNIQKIIKGNSKPKLCINMTTKGPSKKQVIVLMNNINKRNFIKEISVHVNNINRTLKNIKMEVMVDFVQSDSSGIIIVTNKVTSVLELQMLKMPIESM